MTIKLELTEKEGVVRFVVHAKPRAKKSRIVGPSPTGDVLEVALAAPPVDGAVNEELVRVLAEALDVPRRNVTIVRGESARKKLVAVEGLDQATVLAKLGS